MRSSCVEPVVQQQGDAIADAHAAGREHRAEPRRPLVQLGVRATRRSEHERQPIRVRTAAAVEQPYEGAHVLRTVHALTPGAP
jgi:hypothetical protein